MAVVPELVVTNLLKQYVVLTRLRLLVCFKLLCAGVALSGLVACAPSTRAIVDTFGLMAYKPEATLIAPLDSSRRYLRVTSKGRSLLMVLGYEEIGAFGPVQVWYSRSAEVLRLSHDRIIGLVGTPIELIAMRTEQIPEWSRYGLVQFYERQRDLMPGYLYGLVERVSLQAAQKVQPQAFVLTPELQGKTLYWFEEHYSEALPKATFKIGKSLPPSLFAVVFDVNGSARVVYSEQCISSELCLSLQSWGVLQ